MHLIPNYRNMNVELYSYQCILVLISVVSISTYSCIHMNVWLYWYLCIVRLLHNFNNIDICFNNKSFGNDLLFLVNDNDLTLLKRFLIGLIWNNIKCKWELSQLVWIELSWFESKINIIIARKWVIDWKDIVN